MMSKGVSSISYQASNASSSSSAPIDLSKIIVLNPGSLYLKIGRSSDIVPRLVPHVIALRNQSQKRTALCYEEPYLMPASKLDKETDRLMIDYENSILAYLSNSLTTNGFNRCQISKQRLAELNRKVKPSVMSKSSQTDIPKWTKVDANAKVIVGSDVLNLKQNDPFHIHWPFRRGQLNLHSGNGGSLRSVLAMITLIWSNVIQTLLEVDLADIENYKAVLIISDVYTRSHVKELINLLFNDIGFGNVFIHHESVCALFGAGLTFATVVDIGDQKTSVACVEDTISPRCARLTLDYGGSDITQVFYHLLKQRSFPYTDIRPESKLGGQLLQELKESFCHLDLNISGSKERYFYVRVPEHPVLRYSIHLGDECLLAPLTLFHPELFAITGQNKKRIRILKRNEGDPEDPFDENYLVSTKRKYGETLDNNSPLGENSLNNTDQVVEEDACDPCEGSLNDMELRSDHLIGLDQAIVQCIERCDNEDMKKRMFNCILVIGGGSDFNGIDTWIYKKLDHLIPSQYRSGSNLEIIVKPKEIDAKFVVWRGGAVMSLLDTASDFWISKLEWIKFGIRIVREKAAFIW